MKIVIKPEHLQGAFAGYAVGAVYATAMYAMLDRKRVRMFKRTDHFNKILVEKAWVYLPTEVKDEINNEIKFFNISHKEDI